MLLYYKGSLGGRELLQVATTGLRLSYGHWHSRTKGGHSKVVTLVLKQFFASTF